MTYIVVKLQWYATSFHKTNLMLLKRVCWCLLSRPMLQQGVSRARAAVVALGGLLALELLASQFQGFGSRHFGTITFQQLNNKWDGIIVLNDIQCLLLCLHDLQSSYQLQSSYISCSKWQCKIVQSYQTTPKKPIEIHRTPKVLLINAIQQFGAQAEVIRSHATCGNTSRGWSKPPWKMISWFLLWLCNLLICTKYYFCKIMGGNKHASDCEVYYIYFTSGLYVSSFMRRSSVHKTDP